MAKKRCARCNKLKSYSKFNKSATGRLGLHNHCRACQKIVRRSWYIKNRDQELKKASEYSRSPQGKIVQKKRYEKNKERILASNRIRRRTPRARAKANKARNKRYHEDFGFRLAVNLRTRIRSALHGKAKSASTLTMLGCSLDKLKEHLEAQFKSGMSWSTYGYRGWHIDHIIPCSAFDLSKPKQQAKCFHYTNLQPMWWMDNISKGGVQRKDIEHGRSARSG